MATNALIRPCRSPHFTLRLLAAWIVVGAATTLFAQKPCLSTSTPETALLNSLWDGGRAAGNFDDWYRNCDGDHANIVRSDYPQLNDYGVGASGFQTGVVNAPRNVIGNASLGWSGMWGMTRHDGMTSSTANSLYTQYRNSQHYFYPAVYDVRADVLTDRDLSIAMYPYASQSVGKSGTELDEVRKFVHTLAAFKPAVKSLLDTEGLLIPTLQMVWRRSRVASDAEYLSGLAHPSAFDDVANNVAMLQLANGIDTTNRPPMVQLAVLEENYGNVSTQTPRYNDSYRSERRFTTPAAIARVFYGIEHTKRMVVSAESSFDPNGLPLTYRFVVLRGDPSKIRITPLNAAGSRVQLEFDYHPERIVEGTQRLSNLAVIGAFVHNGSYFSAPGFVTSLSLWNETRAYGSDQLLKEIQYNATDINTEVSSSYAVSYSKTWDRDTYTHDFNRRLAGWTRSVGAAQTPYSAEGLIVKSRDADGRPAIASEVFYSVLNNNTTVTQTYTNTSWRSQLVYRYDSKATPAATALTVDLAETNSTLALLTEPAHGTLALTRATGGLGPWYTYTPTAGFAGVDLFAFTQLNSVASNGAVRKVRVVVGPPDTAAPSPVVSVKVTGLSASKAVVTWPKTVDNVEVLKYAVYRDGARLGDSYVTASFEDNTPSPGTSYNYTVTALDDAGNESAASPPRAGGGAALWGQDNFTDGNYTAVDPALNHGLRWTLAQGTATVTGTDKRLALGSNNGTSRSLVVTTGSLAPPFTFEFNDAQQYVTGEQGAVLLYQDTNNFYYLAINKVAGTLRRVMGGVETVVGQSATLATQHAFSSADYQIRVVSVGGAITFEVTKSNWTVSPTAVVTATWSDSDPAAVALFRQGPVGFVQPQLSTYNVGKYDGILVSKLDGVGPDLDDDGLVDVWEIAHFGSTDYPTAEPTLDTDGDGLTNEGEQGAGTDPNDPTSTFQVAMPATSATTFTVRWGSVAGRSYTLLKSPSLAPANWMAVPGLETIAATPPTNELTLNRADFPGTFFLRARTNPF